MSHNNTKVSAIQNEKQNYRYFFLYFFHFICATASYNEFSIWCGSKWQTSGAEVWVKFANLRRASSKHFTPIWNGSAWLYLIKYGTLLLKTLIAFLNAFSWSNFAPGFNQFNFNFLNSLHFIAIIFPIFVFTIKALYHISRILELILAQIQSWNLNYKENERKSQSNPLQLFSGVQLIGGLSDLSWITTSLYLFFPLTHFLQSNIKY